MTLKEFLENKIIEAVEILPDQRLINVVCENEELFGVVVDSIPTDAYITRLSPIQLVDDVIHVHDLAFDSNLYEML